jgi:sensor histidine kinase regulating citrate/malate metabolism
MLFSRWMDRRTAEFQRRLAENHIAEVQNIYREMRGWRHDYHNHIQTIKSYIALGHLDKLEGYLNELDADLTKVDQIIKSGNVVIDAILNSKLSLAAVREIRVTAKAAVPPKLAVNEIDLCVLIGNLLDNAMEACAKLDDSAARFIRVYMDVKHEQLYLSITNSTAKRPKRLGSRYVSEKHGFHGLGLTRADRIVEKCGGWLKRRDEDGVFSTEIMLPAVGMEQLGIAQSQYHEK